MPVSFERGVVILSIDTERIWGYVDCLAEAQIASRFPDSPGAHPRLLALLCEAGVSATWFAVGGLALQSGAGPSDRLLAAWPPRERTSIRARATAGFWHCRAFLDRLRRAYPSQEVGLHGGLTHLLWDPTRVTEQTATCELTEGILALSDVCGTPASFSFPRNREAYYHLLPRHGLRCFRGGPPALAWQLGSTLPGAALRVMEEFTRSTPPAVWPRQALPGLWNIPASMFFYPLGPARGRLIGPRSRLQRFRRGLAAAARSRGIFHFCLHPENLVESPAGFPVFEDILEDLIRARDLGDIEVLTMAGVAGRMERKQAYDCQRQ